MINKLKSWGCKPYPNDDTIVTRIKRAAIFGLFIAVFLAAFKPFGFDEVSGWLLYKLCLGFGLITFVSIVFLNVFLPKLIPAFFDNEKWFVYKEIGFTLLNLVFIGFWNAMYLFLMGYSTLEIWPLIIELQLNTLTVGIIPIVIYVYYDQAKYFKKYALEAEKMSSQISQHPMDLPEDRLLVFKNENGEIEYQVPSSQLLFVKSDGNYLELMIKEADKINKQLLRNRIKNVIEDLPTIFVRCHRSFIVNLEKVRSVDGNARGYELTIANTDIKVPVSRNLAADVLAAIERKTA